MQLIAEQFSFPKKCKKFTLSPIFTSWPKIMSTKKKKLDADPLKSMWTSGPSASNFFLRSVNQALTIVNISWHVISFTCFSANKHKSSLYSFQAWKIKIQINKIFSKESVHSLVCCCFHRIFMIALWMEVFKDVIAKLFQ